MSTKRWIGTVRQIEGDAFWADLRRWGEKYAQLEAEFSMEKCKIAVEEGDEILVTPGSVIRLEPIWTLHHLGPEQVEFLNAKSELEEAEIGSRAHRALKAWDFSNCFGQEGDRILNAVTILMGQVAASTSWQGGTFPPEWDLPEDWEVPR